MAKIINEAEFKEGLGDFVKDGIKGVADRVAYAAGSEKAGGRMDLAAGVKFVNQQWQRYAGRKNIKEPTLRNVADFMKFAFNITIPDEALESIAGNTNSVEDNKPDVAGEPSAEATNDTTVVPPKKANESVILENIDTTVVNMKKLLPRLVDVLMDNGLLHVERNGKVTGGHQQQRPSNEPTKPTQAHPDTAKPGAAPGTPASATVSGGGHSLDINEISRRLKAHNVDPDVINSLIDKARAASDPVELNRAVEGDEKKALLYLAFDTLKSIKDA